MWFEVKKGSITLWDEELYQYHILQVQTWQFLRQARIFFSQSLNQFNHSVIKSWYLIISIIKIISLWIYGTCSFVIDKTTIQNIPLMTWFPLSFPYHLRCHLEVIWGDWYLAIARVPLLLLSLVSWSACPERSQSIRQAPTWGVCMSSP